MVVRAAAHPLVSYKKGKFGQTGRGKRVRRDTGRRGRPTKEKPQSASCVSPLLSHDCHTDVWGLPTPPSNSATPAGGPTTQF